MSRVNTNKLLALIEEGVIDKDYVILACLKYMSEDDVTDMMHANEIDVDDEDDEDDDEDDDRYSPHPLSNDLDDRW